MLGYWGSKEGAMKLQFVHKGKSTLEASSLYCQWIIVGKGEGRRLAAVWIDRKMRIFEEGSRLDAGIEGPNARVREVRGHRPPSFRESETGVVSDQEARRP